MQPDHHKSTSPSYQRNLLLPFLKMLTDVVAVEIAVLLAYYLRFYSPLTAVFPITKGIPEFRTYFGFSVFLSLTMVTLFNYFRAYRSRYFSSFNQDLAAIFKAGFLGILVAMSGAFLYRDVSYSRLVFALIFVNINVLLVITRYLYHKIKDHFLRKGFNSIEVCLVGTPRNLPRIYAGLKREKTRNFRVVGYVCDGELPELGLSRLGGLADLEDLLSRNGLFSGLVIALGQEEHHRILNIMAAIEGKNLELFYVPDILDILTSRFETLEVGGIPFLQLKTVLLAGWQGFLKRFFDVVVSAIALFLLLPLLAGVALLVRLSSPGPVFFRQKRVGLDGIEFEMIKFRSMRSDAEAQSGPVWSVPDDPRTTAIGKILRRTSLDELPQLYNV
ncbi:MAG TPA: sugar transferase, partial [Calditrichia bacterium]|nr:sugar transferase [Calditrichia bacterium]